MAVIRPETQLYGGEHLAAIGVLCGIMCTVLVLKFKGFSANLDFTRKSNALNLEPEAPTVVSAGVYRAYRSEQYDNSSASPSVYKQINPSMVVLPPSPSTPSTQKQPSLINVNTTGSNNLHIPEIPPQLPASPPPFGSRPSFEIIVPGNVQSTPKNTAAPPPSPFTFKEEPKPVITPQNLSKLPPLTSPVSYDPKGAIENGIKAKDSKDSKASKKLTKQEKEKETKRIKEQKKKDKEFIAITLKEDAEKISREANLLREKVKDKGSKKPAKAKADKKEEKKSTKVQAKVANPLAQTSSNQTGTMKSSFSTESAPPPYSASERPKIEATPSEADSSGNTSFSKPVQDMGGAWDMVSQHRQQMRRPVTNNGVASPKVDNLQYDVTKSGGKLQIGQPSKSLNV